MEEQQLLLNKDIYSDNNALSSYEEEQLLNDLRDLDEINRHLTNFVKISEPKLLEISDNLTLSNIKIEKGTEELNQAQKLSFKVLPMLIGGAIGFAVGGPFGFIPGFKAGGLLLGSGLAVGGTILGYKIQK